MGTRMRNGFIRVFHGIAYFVMFHRKSQGISPRHEQIVVEPWLCAQEELGQGHWNTMKRAIPLFSQLKCMLHEC